MSDYEGESNESDSDFEETDSVVWDESDNDIDESEKKNELLEQKLKLILRYNADIVDLDKFNKQLKDINQRLEDLTFVSEYSNNDLLNKEYEFIELLNNYIGVIKKNAQPGFLKDYQIKRLGRGLLKPEDKASVGDVKEQIDLGQKKLEEFEVKARFFS